MTWKADLPEVRERRSFTGDGRTRPVPGEPRKRRVKYEGTRRAYVVRVQRKGRA